MDRLGGKKIELERFAIAVAKFREAFPVWFRPLIARPENPSRIFEQVAVKAARRAVSGRRSAPKGFVIIVNREDPHRFLLRLLDSIVGRDRAFPLGVFRHRVAQLLFARFERAIDLRIEERGQVAIVTLPVILDAEQIFADAPRILQAALGEGGQENFPPVKHVEQEGRFGIAHVREFVHGELAIGFAGMTAHERQFALLRSLRIPLQEMLDFGRLAVFVGAEDADIEIEPRIFEVIRIPAVKSDLLLGSKDQPHVVVTFETIKVIRAALVKRDHIRAQSGFFFALLFNFRDDLLPRRRRLVRA